MNLRRGDILYVAVKGPYTTKPRLVVVVQASATLDLMESVTVCPITSVEVGAAFVRVPVAVGERSGLNPGGHPNFPTCGHPKFPHPEHVKRRLNSGF